MRTLSISFFPFHNIETFEYLIQMQGLLKRYEEKMFSILGSLNGGPKVFFSTTLKVCYGDDSVDHDASRKIHRKENNGYEIEH